MKRPMIITALSAVLLSLVIIETGLPKIITLIVIAAFMFIICISVRKFRIFSVVFAVALVILLNSVFITVNKIDCIENINTQIPVTVTGVVTKENYYDSKVVYIFKTDNANTVVQAGTNISLYSTFAALNEGDTVKCEIYIDTVPEEKRANYYSRGIYAFGTISKVLETKTENNMYSVLSDFRNNVMNKFYKYLSAQSAASINAITVGDKYYLEPEFEEMVKRSGVSHIMVVSGMHMAIICGTFLKLLKMLKLGNRISSVLTAVFVFLFMALCGFSMSVMRAGITYFIMLLSLFIVRRTDALNSLCVAVSVIIMLNPFSAGSISFQLSVLSTVGIIILSRPIANSFLKINIKPAKVVIEAISVTVSALIFTFPVTVYYFGAVSTVTVFTNVLIGQAVTLVLILSACSLPFILLKEFSVIGNGLLFFAELLTKYFNMVINYFGSLPWSYIIVDKSVTIICYLAIILSFVIIKYIEKIKMVVINCAGSIRNAIKG